PTGCPSYPAGPPGGSSKDETTYDTPARGKQPLHRRTAGTPSRAREEPSASQLCQAARGAGRSAVISRIWVVVLGVVALAASCISGCGGGPGTGGPAATRPPVPAGSAGM